MKITILDAASLYNADDSRWGAFASVGDTEVFDRTAPSEIAGRIAGAEMVLTNKVALDDAAISAAAPTLKYIGVLATGYNIIDLEAARAAGITVCNIPAYSTMSVAQAAIALLLAITNRVESTAAENRRGRWPQSPDFTWRDSEWRELAGKSFGVIGFGNTGRATARIAAALGMEILVYTSKPAESLPEGYRKTDLDSIFRQADVVSLHCPLTDSTRHMVNRQRLASMKSDAILLNTSRGPVVDEDALAEALRDHQIHAAGLDVLSQEPPSPDNPLLHLPNCFVTPHTAWASAEARARLFDIALLEAKAFADGDPFNVVS